MRIDDYGQIVPRKHQELKFSIDILGLLRRWQDWRSRHRVEQEQLQEAIEREEQAEAKLADWLARGDTMITKEALIERLKKELKRKEGRDGAC